MGTGSLGGGRRPARERASSDPRKAPATQFPCALFFHCNSLLRKPRLPIRQFGGGDREGEMEFTVSIVGSGHFARGSFFEEQQDLMLAGLQGAAARAEISDDRKPKGLLIELNGAGHVAHVQSGFKDAIRFWTHCRLPSMS